MLKWCKDLKKTIGDSGGFKYISSSFKVVLNHLLFVYKNGLSADTPCSVSAFSISKEMFYNKCTPSLVLY